MTPEEKAERYNEALEMAKIAHKDEDRYLKATLERIFPELKENKDEKIKKALINAAKYYHLKESPYLSDISKEQVISWLEKQGEQKQGPCDNCKDVMLNCHNFKQGKSVLEVIKEEPQVYKTKDGEIITYSETDGYKVEQKPQGKTELEAINEEKVDNANKVEPKDYSSIDPHFGKPIDKVETKDYNNIDPHFDKPADKVEPKFKAGDWIVWQGKYFKVNYNGCGYELTDQNGKSTSLEYGAVDKTANLWRIQDAKAGDVLYSPKDPVVERIVLIGGWKQLDGYSTLCAPITYRVKENEIEVPIVGAIWWNGVINSFCPATKEQRDTLMKAMADAGYTFDFEKKELKKIEDEIEIPFGAKDSELQEAIYYIPKGFHAEIDDDKVVVKKGEKPTAWSEMDKAITRAISSNLELLKNRGSGEVSEAVYQSEIKWLKALKRRVGYDEEWSEEDETALGDTLWAIEQAKTVAKNESEMGNIWYAERWLKSLKYRVWSKNNYNPYKEVVESIAKMCERYDKYSHSILKDFYNNVKVKCKDAKEFDSLHPQNTKTISQ